MTTQDIQDRIASEGFVPLFTHTNAEVARNVIKACYNAGIRVFEYTNRNPQAVDVFIELRKFVSENFPDFILGAGTIKNARDVEQFIAAGADFLISPLISEEIHHRIKQHKILWIPGCATASEIGQAENWGIRLIKIFPAKQLGGPSYIKGIRAVFPAMHYLVTGGVEPTQEDLKAWFDAGVTGVGMGSNLIQPEWLEHAEYDKVTERFAQIKKIIGSF